MSKRMLIDGTHPEEVRVVVTSGNRLEEYDIETSTKLQIKGNIYLAKVTRVEPSLQAAFVDFGGNRHGFLAFNEIHPDYYQIPIADREALLAEEARLDDNAQAAQAHAEEMDGGIHDAAEEEDDTEEAETHEASDADALDAADADADADDQPESEAGPESDGEPGAESDGEASEEAGAAETAEAEGKAMPASGSRRRNSQQRRRYKIQEVIKRRQILLVQVVKEERGNKGAALTTYLSLAGRYCVLMPNTPRGGGISRKITSAAERRKLKDILSDLEIPEGMGVIMRTAGMERSKAEIKRDFEFLLRAWENVREKTLHSIAPALVYEEASLIKRAIRDLYNKDIEEVQVEGGEAYQIAKRFMRLLMPSHAKRVQPYKDGTMPLFHRFQVESQLDAMYSPEVQLKSGGYLVMHSTEALVAIDVNSGRSTKERNIEETALKTNIEAAEEVARQLRLRDLAGLIVIDFIDMEENRNLRRVEKVLKEAMKVDRARIQIGRISTFGLLEMSRQRLRPSLIEASTQVCPHCQGTGNIRSIESMAVRVLRALEEEGIRWRTSALTVAIPTPVALYILNQKRAALSDIEQRYQFSVTVLADDRIILPDMEIERTQARAADEKRPEAAVPTEIVEIEDEEEEEAAEAAAEAAAEPAQEGSEPRKRRSRRSRRKKTPAQAAEAVEPQTSAAETGEAPVEAAEAEAEEGPTEEQPAQAEAAEESGTSKRRRRGRRGGRRRSSRQDGESKSAEEGEAPAGEAVAELFAGEPAETEPADEAPGPVTADTEPAPESAEQPAEAEPAEAEPAAVEAAPEEPVAEEPAVEEPAAPEPEAEPEPALFAAEPEPAPVTPEPAEIVVDAASPAQNGEHAEPTNGEDRATNGESAAEPENEVPPEIVPDRPRRRGWWLRRG